MLRFVYDAVHVLVCVRAGACVHAGMGGVKALFFIKQQLIRLPAEPEWDIYRPFLTGHFGMPPGTK